MHRIHNRTFHWVPCLATMAIAFLATTGVTQAQESTSTLQLIPSIGVTKSTDSNAGDAQGFGGLALRAALTPMIKLEGGIGYRQDSYVDGAIKVHQWPVSASLWLTPVPSVYFGGGVGWYHSTIAYSAPLTSTDTTTDKGGVHIGGGFEMPIAPKLSIDLNGRYIFMAKDKATFDVPTTFNPDFWTASVGLAIGF